MELWDAIERACFEEAKVQSGDEDCFEWAQREALRLSGPIDEKAAQDIRSRLRLCPAMQAKRDQILADGIEAYRRVFGAKPNLKKLSIGVSRILVPDGKIAVYHRFENDDGLSEGAICIHPKALQDMGYLDQVLRHEICHYLLNTGRGEDPHSQKFELLADAIGLDPQHRD